MWWHNTYHTIDAYTLKEKLFKVVFEDFPFVFIGEQWLSFLESSTTLTEYPSYNNV